MKLAIISGGSRGLGAALYNQYQADGYTVRELSRSGQTDGSVTVDLTVPGAMHGVLAPLFAELAGLDWTEVLLFNNAGLINPVGPVATKSADEVLANIHVNYSGAILLMREFMRAFQDSVCPKTIANISSGAAVHSIRGWSLYCAAKAGIEHFIRTVAIEQADEAHPIRMLNIQPGIIDTDMQADIRAAAAGDFPDLARFVDYKESGALRSPEEVAGAIQTILRSDPKSGGQYAVRDFLPGTG